MALAAVVIYNGWAESLQTKVPGYAQWAQDLVEGNTHAERRLAELRGDHGPPVFVAGGQGLAKVSLEDYGAAPNLRGISAWINSAQLDLEDLRGKVVLLDFWTYSCINCLRTLPYLEKWDARYRTRGLVILGIHTPEFAFEHDLGNVRAAVRRLGVRYPVALDNEYGTWEAYSNHAWPAHYLIDQTGRVREIHVGEGDYDRTERNIRLLLAAGHSGSLPRDLPDPDRTPRELRTPETYLGYLRIGNYTGSPLQPDRQATYKLPPDQPGDTFAYAGTWTVEGERIVAGRNARLRIRFLARDAHIVLAGRGTVRVTLNGVRQEPLRVSSDRLYTVASQGASRAGLLELAFSPGVAAYAFTFG
jgi:thiol-disulfide isomerase/thioredoxin